MSAAPPARPSLEIRAFREPDREALLQLWRDERLTFRNVSVERELSLCLGAPQARLFVGIEGGRIIASILCGFDGHRGWIYRAVTHRDHRRRGLARQMVAHAEAWLAERGAPKINLQIDSENAAAQGFWERVGFVVETRISMGKRLPPLPQMSGAAGVAPPGQIKVVITYLEMNERPRPSVTPPPAGLKLAVLRADELSVPFYRYLYDSVGGPWLWYERRRMSDGEIAAIVNDPQVDVFVLYAAGEPAGYVELDRRVPSEIELAYFGLTPRWIGRGLGPFLLHWAIDAAWRREPKRVWVHTCNLDHPKAIAFYQRAGFVPYKQESKFIDDPRPLP
ncbi:MAG TPA: GNAT family acetyltransferase [Alphaproteobacteria bacterium]|nr:GNAT family acetyltransferase [Alphaproteobacteria bacterium]